MPAPDVIAALLDRMPHRILQVGARRVFRDAGSPHNEVILVKSGILSMFKTTASEQQIVALRYAGEIILPRSSPAQYAIQAIVPSEVIVADETGFHHQVDGSSEMRRLLLRGVQRQEAISQEWLVNCGRRNSTERVAHFLCETALRLGVGDQARMRNPFTQQQIADITGQTSVNVNRVLGDLERQGLITRNGREMEFVDWPELRRLASFQSGYLEL